MAETEEPLAEESREERVDPKEAMRQALERKKQQEHNLQGQGLGHDRGEAHAHGKIGGKREFRRKSG